MCVGNPYSVAMSSRQPRKRRKVTASNNGSIKPFWVVVGGLVVAGARVPVVARQGLGRARRVVAALKSMKSSVWFLEKSPTTDSNHCSGLINTIKKKKAECKWKKTWFRLRLFWPFYYAFELTDPGSDIKLDDAP